jgi:hypothetical protein
VVKHLRPPLLEFFEHRQLELLGIRHPTQARYLRGQFQLFGDEALILAIEEETDLAKRFTVMFLRQLHHLSRI